MVRNATARQVEREEQRPVVLEPHGGVAWQARLLLLAAIWGMSFLFIKVGDEALAPLQVALARMTLGTLTLSIVLALRREGPPRGLQVWGHLAVAAVLFNSLPFALFAYGELHTTSILAGIWNGTTPLFAAPIAIATLRDERLTGERAAGLLLGFAGVLIVLGAWHGFGGSQMVGNLLCLGAALSYGIGFPYTRKYLSGRQESMVALAWGQLLCGTLQLAVVTPFLTSLPTGIPLKVAGSILALGALGTGFAYILNYGLIREVGATAASTVTYLVPIFATIVGIIVLGEPFAWYEPVGGAVVILGVAVAQGRLRVVPHNRPRS